MEKKLGKLKKEFEIIRNYDDVQFQYKIYSHFINISKMVWWMRCIPISKFRNTSMKFDFMFKEFIQSMMGRVVDVNKWSHITNALKRGGLGLRTGSHLLAAFYLPSIYATDDILPRLLHPTILEYGLSEINRRKEEALIDYNSRVQNKYMIIDFNKKIHTTTYLCSKIELNIMNNHINTLNDRDRAHYISQLNRTSNSYLLLPMGKWNGIRFTNVEMRAIFYRKLGLNLIISKERCINCGEMVDTYGDHGSICMYDI